MKSRDDYADGLLRRRRPIRCHDGFCGADDCPTCHPGSDRPEEPEPMHDYLNNLLCAAAPCDGEMQAAIEHAITRRVFNPAGNLLADNETIGREGAQWLIEYREHLERQAEAARALDPLFEAIAKSQAA